MSATHECMNPGRNDPCPCGSRQRYKSCCGRLKETAPAGQPALDPTVLPMIEAGRLAELLDGARYTELESATRELLDARPQSAPLWQLLGVARTRQGKDPLHALEMAVQCTPGDAAAHLNLGNALARLGRPSEAAASYARALDIDPGFAEAHNNLGLLRLELRRAEEALVSCRQAVRSKPEFADAHHNVGRALLRLGRFDEALLSCRRAVSINSQFAEAHNTLGSALLGLASVQEAITSFQRALEINPDLAEAHANRAHALRGIGRLEEAVAGYRRALAIQPRLVLAHTEMATALRLQHRGDEAEESCRAALGIDPDCTAAFVVLAELRADAGRFDAAEEFFRRAISADPASPEAWAGLARVRRMTPSDESWLAATQHLVAQKIPPQQELLLRYAIGKYFDDIGEFGRAFQNYQRANELAKGSGPPHDRAALSAATNLIIRSHDQQWTKCRRRHVEPSVRPVLIVGMLRSGTTLTEQILASHPQVFGAGELTFWSRVTAEALSGTPTPSATALRISDSALADLGERYLHVLQGLSPDALRVVDKLPTNFLSLGLIHAALPRAQIIHLVRHPIDTCLSIYFQHFEAANTYTHDLGDLAHYYGEYWRLMAHWRSVLPADTLLQVPYEGLVADLPTWARKMVEFIGLPWDPRCLEFHSRGRSVVTASKWQVRQRVFGSSVGRWRHYERFVAPLTPLLDLRSD